MGGGCTPGEGPGPRLVRDDVYVFSSVRPEFRAVDTSATPDALRTECINECFFAHSYFASTNSIKEIDTFFADASASSTKVTTSSDHHPSGGSIARAPDDSTDNDDDRASNALEPISLGWECY